MQQLSHRPDKYSSTFKTFMNYSRRFVIACLCAEKCRICGNEIALTIATPALIAKSSNNAEDAGETVIVETSSPVRKKRYAGILSSYGIKPEKRKRADYNVPSEFTETPGAPSKAKNESKMLSAPRIKLGASQNAFLQLLLRKIHPFFNISGAIYRKAAEEIAAISVESVYSPQVLPAFLFFSKQPSINPRLSDCLCHNCWQDIEIDTPSLGFCSLSSPFQKKLPIASGVTYKGKIKDLIRAFKYEGDTTLAADLTSIMSLGWFALGDYLSVGELIIVPVPLHKSRQNARGFNQAELLAKELGHTLSVRVSTHALRRVKATRPQQVLGREERLKNVCGAFIGKQRLLTGKNVVLVDDVFTSGSTLLACAEEVLRCGASNVVALTAAKAILASES